MKKKVIYSLLLGVLAPLAHAIERVCVLTQTGLDAAGRKSLKNPDYSFYMQSDDRQSSFWCTVKLTKEEKIFIAKVLKDYPRGKRIDDAFMAHFPKQISKQLLIHDPMRKGGIETSLQWNKYYPVLYQVLHDFYTNEIGNGTIGALRRMLLFNKPLHGEGPV